VSGQQQQQQQQHQCCGLIEFRSFAAVGHGHLVSTTCNA
jgi:hypothetical protein